MKIPEELAKEMPEALKDHFTKKDKFILDENKNAIPADLLEWGEFFEKEDRIVKQEEVNGYRVSTVFLGLDHNWLPMSHEDHELQIFETMIFKAGTSSDIYLDRYATWQEAEEGHKKAVQWVKDGCKEDDDV